MAQLMSVKLSRSDATPWGFRLQGGKDFGSPLLIQKVNGGSPAERAGLQAGDAVVKVNNVEVFNLRHKDAQDNIVRAGNSFEITVQRGGSTWKPAVTPVGPQPVMPQSAGHITPVTKTSLAANKPAASPIGGGHNYSPAPFAPQQQMNGNGMDPVKSIVNKQYNSPVGIYSEETIAETLSAQAEVLAGGVLGVNFKKNERNYDPANSEVFKMLNEIANEPRTPEPDVATPCFERPAPAPMAAAVPFSVAGLRHVTAPEPRPLDETNKTVLPPGQNICGECERLVVGVFVRIKDKNLHVECFKCATCGTSLKNVGYYNINNKLYCDVHAKLVARQQPPGPNMVPITVAPGAPKPAGAISAALASRGPMAAPAPAPASPLASNFAPMPFHPIPLTNEPSPDVVLENIIEYLPSVDLKAGEAPPVDDKPYKAPRTIPTHVQSPRPVQAPGGFSGVKPSFNAAPPMPSMPSMPSMPAPAPFTTPAKPAAEALVKTLVDNVKHEDIPVCNQCNQQITRGPFVTALGKIWCPEHFVCVNAQCKRQLADIGFVEEKGQLYCEYCFEQYIAPACTKCSGKIKGDCLNAIGKSYHPECFVCCYCNKLFGNNPFFLEDGMPYCQADWNELFTTKCFACGFPIEAGDRWVEALNNNYHSQCFNCTSCKKNLEGQSFFAKSGRPFCKAHAR